MSALSSASKDREYVAKMQEQKKQVRGVSSNDLTRRSKSSFCSRADVRHTSRTRPRSDSRDAREGAVSEDSQEEYNWVSYYYNSEMSTSEFDDDDDDWADDKSEHKGPVHSWTPNDNLEEVLLNSFQNFNNKSTSDRLYSSPSISGRSQSDCKKFHRGGDSCPRCAQDVLPHQIGDFKEELSVLRQALLASL